VSITGRSMIRTIEVASELGYLDIPDGVLVELEDLNKLDKDKSR
jgi:ribonuclease J